jgi:predicted nucleic acid-binding protein
MPAFFFDTSAIVKRYIDETGSGWVQNTADPAFGNMVYIAAITAVEVTSAVARRQQGGFLKAPKAAAVLAQFRKEVASEYGIIAITQALLTNAATLAERHCLRAHDAVQLAVAVELHTLRITNGLSALTLVSADQDLNTAAATEGLLVEDPNSHP